MKILNLISLLTLSITLYGCGPDKEAETEKISQQDTQSEAEEERKTQQHVLLGPHMKALEKAKGVEQLLLDAEAARMKKIEALEAGKDDEDDPG